MRVEGRFEQSITDWVGGEVVYRDPTDSTNYIVQMQGSDAVTYQLTSNPSGTIVNSRSPITFYYSSGQEYSYIKISGSMSTGKILA